MQTRGRFDDLHASTPASGATFSDCRRYRYCLWRIWDESIPPVAFVCLNPSTADESKNDPTVTRCINFSRAWGGGGFVMLNAFAYRATDPLLMKAQDDPVGPDNDRWLVHYHQRAQFTVAAWGVHGAFRDRQRQVLELLEGNRPLYCLGLTKDGHPKHPLYLPNTSQPVLYLTEIRARRQESDRSDDLPRGTRGVRRRGCGQTVGPAQ